MSKEKNMKIGLCTIAFSELPLEEVLNISEEYSFDGVEIWGKEPHTPEEYDEDYPDYDLVATVGETITIDPYGYDPDEDFHGDHHYRAFAAAVD